jgi:ferredoxin
VDPRLCTGCGACEHVCPVRDKAAIRVTCAGESRSPRSSLLLVDKRPR